jgi:hypothetical protein
MNPYICFSLYKAIFRGLVIYIYFTSIVYVCYYDINNVCKVNVHYEPPEDGLVKAETYVGVKE